MFQKKIRNLLIENKNGHFWAIRCHLQQLRASKVLANFGLLTAMTNTFKSKLLVVRKQMCMIFPKKSGTCQSTTKIAICEPFDAVCSTWEHQNTWQTFFCSLLWPTDLKLSYWFLGKKSMMFPKKGRKKWLFCYNLFYPHLKFWIFLILTNFGPFLAKCLALTFV